MTASDAKALVICSLLSLTAFAVRDWWFPVLSEVGQLSALFVPVCATFLFGWYLVVSRAMEK